MIRVRAVFGGVAEGRPITVEGQVELPDGATVKKFFKKADERLGCKKEKYFRRVPSGKLPVSVLLNGNRLDLPQGLKTRLQDGDEITVIMPLAGG